MTKKDTSYTPEDDELLRWQKSLQACEIGYAADTDNFNEQQIKKKWQDNFSDEISSITTFYGKDVHFDDGNKKNDVRGTIIRTNNNKVFVSVRGTNSLDDVVSDANGIDDVGGGKFLNNIEIHRGFHNIFDKLEKDAIYESIKSDMEDGAEIVWTGHSMGGAEAELLALYFHERFKQGHQDKSREKETVVVFGGANYTNAAGVDKVNDALNVTHIVHGNDPIAKMSTSAGYYETGFRVNMPDSDKNLLPKGEAPSSVGDFIDHALEDYWKGLTARVPGEFYTSNPNAWTLERVMEAAYHCLINESLKSWSTPANSNAKSHGTR
jgi:hypothetical protein